MKIIINRTNEEHQSAKVVIDTKGLYYPYSIRDSIRLALSLDGHTEEGINEIFGIMPDAVCDTFPIEEDLPFK